VHFSTTIYLPRLNPLGPSVERQQRAGPTICNSRLLIWHCLSDCAVQSRHPTGVKIERHLGMLVQHAGWTRGTATLTDQILRTYTCIWTLPHLTSKTLAKMRCYCTPANSSGSAHLVVRLDDVKPCQASFAAHARYCENRYGPRISGACPAWPTSDLRWQYSQSALRGALACCLLLLRL
jgi:hypothetical protein